MLNKMEQFILISLRVSREEKEEMEKAAKVEYRTLSNFIRKSALENAKNVLEKGRD